MGRFGFRFFQLRSGSKSIDSIARQQESKCFVSGLSPASAIQFNACPAEWATRRTIPSSAPSSSCSFSRITWILPTVSRNFLLSLSLIGTRIILCTNTDSTCTANLGLAHIRTRDRFQFGLELAVVVTVWRTDRGNVAFPCPSWPSRRAPGLKFSSEGAIENGGQKGVEFSCGPGLQTL